MVTDLAAYNIGPQNSAFAQDLISPSDVATQRKGWAYDGTTADAAVNLKGIWRAEFILADVTRTLTASDSVVYIHNPSAGGTSVATSLSGPYLPRAMYRDELFLCAQDGHQPVLRYSGAGAASDAFTAGQTVDDTAQFTATSGTFSSDVAPGWYLVYGEIAPFYIRVLEKTSTTSITLEGVRWTSSSASGAGVVQATGLTTPCVSVYNASTISAASDPTVEGAGTKWSTGDWGSVVAGEDALLPIDPDTGNAAIIAIDSVTDDDTLEAGSTLLLVAGTTYHIMRPAPFRDVAAHKGSFWGTGVAQYPDRVYYSPQGWNPSFPPGLIEPVDPRSATFGNPSGDYFLEFIDVPSPFDGDGNVAILESPNPLLVLKRHAVYGVYGEYPTVASALIADGAGCIDIRSAWSFEFGQVWAGETGIFAYINGQVVDLTDGRINREWRALTADFDFGTSDYCTIGEVYGHLIVHITTGGGTTHRTYAYDLRDGAWMSRLTNHKSRYFFSAKVPGEAEKLLWVGDDDQGRVMNSEPAVSLTGIAKDGDGTSPRLQAWTGTGIAGGIDNLSRVVDLQVSANVVDAGAAGSTQMAVSVVSGGGIGNPADSTKTLADIDSDTADRIDRHNRKVAREGRFHQVRLDVDTLGTNTSATKVEIAQISASIRDSRVRA